MNRRILGVAASLASLLVPLGVVAPAPASAACSDYVNKKWVRTAFVSKPDAWHFYLDNRQNPEVQTLKVEQSVSRTITKSSSYSGEVSTSVKTGLKFLAEGKVDVTFGTERSTQNSVTGTTTVGWELKFPAYTEAVWDYGIFTVTAFKSRYYRDYQCRSHLVYRAKRTWPVYQGWDYDKISYAK